MNQPRTQGSPAARPRPSMYAAKEARARVLAPVVPPGWVGAGCGVSKGAFALTPPERLSPRRLHLIDPPFLMAREWPWGEGDRNPIPAGRARPRTVEDHPFALARRPDHPIDRRPDPSHRQRGGGAAVSETVARDEFETVLADQPTPPWAVLLPG